MSKRPSLEDKVVVVTGAARGIGRDTAILAAREGAAVIVNDFGGSTTGEGHDDGPAHQVVTEIEAFGGRAVANTDSVSDRDGARRIIENAMDAFGRVDGVVNNAGILRDKIFHQMTEEDFDVVIDVHLRGSFYVARAAAPHMRKQQGGAMVHMTSTAALIGNIGQANYAAAKAGIAALSRSIAIDMQRFGIRSNCIAPFAWSRLINTMPKEAMERNFDIAKMQAVSTDKIAPMIVFLLSDLSDGVTGQVFAVRKDEVFLMSQPRPFRQIHKDGGWSVQDLAQTLLPAFKPSLVELDSSADVFAWEAI